MQHPQKSLQQLRANESCEVHKSHKRSQNEALQGGILSLNLNLNFLNLG